MKTKNANTYDTQTARFLSTVITCMPEINPDIMQGWIENPRTLKKVLAEALTPPPTNPELTADFILKILWTEIYKNWFGREVDFSGLVIPKIYDYDKHFVLIVAEGISINEVVEAMRKKFKVSFCTVYFSNDAKSQNQIVNESYVILFEKNIEADENFKNWSNDELASKNIKNITLLERLLLEILYFNQKREHLDSNNRTLCFGSRDLDNSYFLGAYWNSGNSTFCVDAVSDANNYIYLRGRAAVYCSL